MLKSKILFPLLFFPLLLFSQRSNYTNKYSLGFEMNFGHSFPVFPRNQQRWKGTFYPSGGINVSLNNRLHEKWMAEVAIGLTAYFLTNQGPVDKYILDFASPQASTGISYVFGKRPSQKGTLKLSYGLQLGYKGRFVDQFETYTVTVQGDKRWYHFIRTDLGIRRYFKKKQKGIRYKIAYEYGAYFRLNLNRLGTVVFEETDFLVTTEPRGNLIGVYFKFLFPVGKKRMEVKKVEEEIEIPPVIYYPRYSK